MPTIGTQENLITLINVFTVLPEKQQHLIEVLNHASCEIMSEIPGFISATIHRSLNGTRVTNYAQWKSVEDIQRMLDNPAVTPHLQEIKDLAEKVEPMLYEVVHSAEKREGDNA